MLKHHRELQAQKKLEAARKAEEEAAEDQQGGEGLDTETSTTTDAESQAEPQASTSAGEALIVGSSYIVFSLFDTRCSRRPLPARNCRCCCDNFRNVSSVIVACLSSIVASCICRHFMSR